MTTPFFRVTGINIGLSTKQLLDKMGWLSIYQLAIYHSILLFWKVNNKLEPKRTVEILNRNQYSKPRIELTSRVWSKIAPNYFNKLDPNIKKLKKIGAFKRTLKNWIKLNVPLSEDSEDPIPGPPSTSAISNGPINLNTLLNYTLSTTSRGI